MKKLYLAIKTYDTIFASDEVSFKLDRDADIFCRHEGENIVYNRISYHEISKIENVPKQFRGTFIHGIKEDITPEQFFEQSIKNNSEYKEYLRLKEKFSKFESVDPTEKDI